jgi:hypothetical protein
MNNDVKNVNNIWKRKNPFKKEEEKVEVKAIEKEVIEIEQEKKILNPITGRAPALLVIQDATITINDPIIKLDISVLNKGKGTARDVKLKVIASPMLKPLTTPMVALGDLPHKDKKQSLVQFEMSQKFVDRQTNFSLMCSSDDSVTASLVCTCQTGRRPLSATELLEKKEQEMRAKFGKGTAAPKKGKGKGKKKG